MTLPSDDLFSFENVRGLLGVHPEQTRRALVAKFPAVAGAEVLRNPDAGPPAAPPRASAGRLERARGARGAHQPR